MQSDPNDAYYPPKMEELQPNTPYRPVPPSYQQQPAQPYIPPPAAQYQYAAQQPETAGRSAPDRTQTAKYRVAKLMDYLQWVLGVLELLFLGQFVLKLLGADPSNPFAEFIYNLAGFFLAPFSGIVPVTHLGKEGIAVIEWSTLIGMAVYAMLFYLVKLLLRITISRPEEPIG